MYKVCSAGFVELNQEICCILFPYIGTMANKVIKFLNETYGKQSLLESVKAGGWKGLIDGNIAWASILAIFLF